MELLLDVSGSMNEHIPALKDSAAIVSRGLDEAEIDHEVRGFSSDGDYPLYRGFDEKADWKLGAMRAGMSTDLAGGVSRVRASLKDRTEKQKLAVVLTDGEPDDEEAAKRELVAARREGVTVLGVYLRPGRQVVEAYVDRYYKTAPEDARNRERERCLERLKESEAKMTDLFGGRAVILDDVGGLPKVAGKKIVDLLRRRS